MQFWFLVVLGIGKNKGWDFKNFLEIIKFLEKKYNIGFSWW